MKPTCYIRFCNKVGFDIPIAVGLDFHANNTDEICELANVICGFRTAPHIDQIETEQRTMRLLLTCIQKKILPRPRIARPYVVVPGDAVQTALSPLNKIMQTAEELEREPGILCAQVFGGQGWVDVPYMSPSMVVTHEQDEEKAQRYADMLAEKYYNARYDFKFHVEAVDAQEAVKRAMAADTQVFITDSGDNTTAGAAGDNAHMLNVLLRAGAKNVLLAGIMDREAVKKCYASNIGDTLTLTVGGSLSDIRESAHNRQARAPWAYSRLCGQQKRRKSSDTGLWRYHSGYHGAPHSVHQFCHFCFSGA